MNSAENRPQSPKLLDILHRHKFAILKAVVSLGLIVLVMRRMDFGVLASEIQNAALLPLAIGTALIFVQTAAGAARWHAIMRAQGGRVSLLTTFRIYYVGVFFTVTTPGGVFGDLVRAWHAHRAGLELAASIGSTILDRLVVLLFLVLATILALPYLPPGAQIQAPGWAAMSIASLIFLGFFVVPLGLKYLPASIRSIAIVQEVMPLLRSILVVVVRPVFFAWIFLFTAVTQIMLCTAIYFLSRSVGIDIGFMTFIILMPAVILASVLPISVGGWGVREAAMVFMLGFYGVPSERALLLSVLVGTLAIVISLPGGIVWMLAPEARKISQRDSAGLH